MEKREKSKSIEDLVKEANKLRAAELEKANEEIREVCKKYECGLDAEVTISRGDIVPRVFVVDLKRQL